QSKLKPTDCRAMVALKTEQAQPLGWKSVGVLALKVRTGTGDSPGAGWSGAGVSGVGVSGAGASGAGVSGAGVSGVGISGAGVSGPGCSGAPGRAPSDWMRTQRSSPTMLRNASPWPLSLDASTEI